MYTTNAILFSHALRNNDITTIISNELVDRSHEPSRSERVEMSERTSGRNTSGETSFILARSFPEIASYKNSTSGLS